jgi:hypothetical protein
MIEAVNFLTKQQKQVLCCILFLLVTGWAVRTWRLAHPPAPVTASSSP